MKLVCIFGGRTYSNRARMVREIEALRAKYGDELCIVEGGANGADKLAGGVAGDMGIDHITAHANWYRLGKSAGHRRNRVMASLPLVEAVAFPGGVGTANMRAQVTSRGVLLREIAE